MKPVGPQRLNGCRCVNTASYLMTPTTKLNCAANGGECLKEKNKAQLLTQPWTHSNQLKSTWFFGGFFFWLFFVFLPEGLATLWISQPYVAIVLTSQSVACNTWAKCSGVGILHAHYFCSHTHTHTLRAAFTLKTLSFNQFYSDNKNVNVPADYQVILLIHVSMV